MAHEEDISAYLSNLNHISKKFPDASNDECDNISELLDLLKIPCGEKIVVDFDNEDGWTWRDEHSGPFSWMTRSQQDLTEMGTDQDLKNIVDLQTPRKNTFSIDDSGTTGSGLSEIQAAFQKFGLNSVDESEHTKQITTVEVEKNPGERTLSISSDTEVPSSLSSASPSPVHQVASSPSFSPIHQPVTTNMRKWVDADRSDTEAEESLISQNLSGYMSPSFVLEPPEEFKSDALANPSSIDIAGVHRVSNHDISVDKNTSVFLKEESIERGYDNTGIDLGTDLNSESTTDVQKTGFDFLDNW